MGKRYGGWEGRAVQEGVRYDLSVDLKIRADGTLTTDSDESVGKVRFASRTVDFVMMDRVRSVPDLAARLEGDLAL
jgi:hypothetical protein